MPNGIDLLMLKQIAEVEKKDEDQVLAELAGEQLEEMIYTIEVYDRRLKRKVTKVKLSWAGTKEVARSRGNIVLSDPVVTDMDDRIRFMVKATDLTRNFTIFGGCQQLHTMKVNDLDSATGAVIGHHYEDDPFCFQKGLSKCQRNALVLCIPADYTAKCISRFLKATGKRQILPQEVATKKAPAKSQIKPQQEWDKITREMVTNYTSLEPIIWNLTKLQPKAMYQELGVNSRDDMTIPAWEAFLILKERLMPIPKEEYIETGD